MDPVTRYVLQGARVWTADSPDGGSTTRAPVSIWVDRGGIASLGRDPGGQDWQRLTVPEGSVAIPGLIDGHVHMDLDPGLLSPDEQFAPTRRDRDLRMVARAAAMVRAGITTARDLGAGEWRELALRDAIARGELPGPRLLCAGQPVTIPGGHCHFWGGAADGPAEQLAVIERQLSRGVDWIKIMATGGVFTKGSDIGRAQFPADDVAAMVSRSRRGGREVAAHCHSTAGIRHAARGGVRTVEHCSFAGPDGFGSAFDPAAVRDLVEHGTWVSPTVNAGWARRIEKDGRETRFHLRMRAVFRALREAGVPLLASTDAGIPGVRHDGLPGALAVLAHYASLDPLEALLSATRDAARALGLESECGVLRPGAAADLLVLPNDPLRDLSCLEQPLLVLARGRLVLDRRVRSEPVDA